MIRMIALADKRPKCIIPMVLCHPLGGIVGFSIVVLAYDGLSPFHLAVPGVVFGELRMGSSATDWQIRVCGITKGDLRTSDGYSVRVEGGLDELSRSDMIIVPSWPDPDVKPPGELLSALVAAHQRGAKIVGLCLGAFVLAAAGLLNGRRATTHWRCTDQLAEEYPLVSVDPAVLYIDEGDVMTSAGTAASLDACLHIIRTRLGTVVANQVARGLVVAPHREGGQSQYIERPVPVPNSRDAIGRVLKWALEHLEEALTVDVLAAKSNMSRRNFTRAFLRSTGETPADWIRSQRLREAQRLLEVTTLSVDQVATMSGFASTVTLRQNFLASFGVSPAAYRRSYTPTAAVQPGRQRVSRSVPS